MYFFEMPNDSRLVRMKSRKELRVFVKKEFPDIPYREENNYGDIYKTSDGIHLTWRSAVKFTEYFTRNILTGAGNR